jgi:hypothetical protein
MKDEILDEVRRHREAAMTEHGCNLDAYVAYLKKIENSSSRKTVSFEGRKPKPGYWGRTSSKHRAAALIEK